MRTVTGTRFSGWIACVHASFPWPSPFRCSAARRRSSGTPAGSPVPDTFARTPYPVAAAVPSVLWYSPGPQSSERQAFPQVATDTKLKKCLKIDLFLVLTFYIFDSLKFVYVCYSIPFKIYTKLFSV